MNAVDALRISTIILAMGAITALGMRFAFVAGGVDGLVIFLILYCLLAIAASTNPKGN